MGKIKSILCFDIFPFICRFISIVLLSFALHELLTKGSEMRILIELVGSAFFLLVPVARIISVGRLFTFEKSMHNVRKDVREFKAETREELSIYRNMISNISNTISHTVNVNLPSLMEAQQAKHDLNESLKVKDEPNKVDDEIDAFIADAGGDYNFALAKLRMEIESALRKLLGLQEDEIDFGNRLGQRPLSARQLFKEFTDKYPEYEPLESSFSFILRICNAAIHGQIVYEKYAREAIHMGIRMLKELTVIGESSVK